MTLMVTTAAPMMKNMASAVPGSPWLERRFAGCGLCAISVNIRFSRARRVRRRVRPLALAGAFRDHVARSAERKAIAISSRLGSMAANDSGGLYVYRSSKAALNAVWRSFALDNKDLTAVVFHPGWVATDMGGSSAPV